LLSPNTCKGQLASYEDGAIFDGDVAMQIQQRLSQQVCLIQLTAWRRLSAPPYTVSSSGDNPHLLILDYIPQLSLHLD